MSWSVPWRGGGEEAAAGQARGPECVFTRGKNSMVGLPISEIEYWPSLWAAPATAQPRASRS